MPLEVCDSNDQAVQDSNSIREIPIRLFLTDALESGS